MNKVKRKAEEKERDEGEVERENGISRGITEIGFVKQQVRVVEILRPGWFLCDGAETVTAKRLGDQWPLSCF